MPIGSNGSIRDIIRPIGSIGVIIESIGTIGPIRPIGSASRGRLPREHERGAELAIHAERVFGDGDAARFVLHEQPRAQRDLPAPAPRAACRRADSGRGVWEERERVELRELPHSLELRPLRRHHSSLPKRRISAVPAHGRFAPAAAPRGSAAPGGAPEVDSAYPRGNA